MSREVQVRTNPLAFKVTGLIVASVTAFKSDGSVNLEIIPTQVKRLVDSGVNGAWITGTTGESLSLTLQERKEIAETWMKAVEPYPDFHVIVHTGAANIHDSIELSKHAESIKAHAIAAVPPQFFKPENIESLVSTMKLIAASVPKTPFYYYHIPYRTNVSVKMYDFLSNAVDQIPTLVGMKYTWTDMMDFSDCTRFFAPKFNMVMGHEELMLPAASFGCDAFVGSTFNMNFLINTYKAVLDSVKNNNLSAAMEAQQRSHDFVSLLFKYGGMATLKAILKLQGVDVGDVRLPLQGLSANKVEFLKRDLEKLGFSI